MQDAAAKRHIRGTGKALYAE